jgi:hypothetical protein
MGNPIVNLKIIDAAGANNMTGTAIVPSRVIDTWDLSAASLEIQITGTPNGTLTLEGSNQYDPVSNPNATFVPLPSSTMIPSLPAVVGQGAISYLGSVATGARYIRLRYVNASSTGQLNVWFSGTGAN